MSYTFCPNFGRMCSYVFGHLVGKAPRPHLLHKRDNTTREFWLLWSKTSWKLKLFFFSPDENLTFCGRTNTRKLEPPMTTQEKRRSCCCQTNSIATWHHTARKLLPCPAPQQKLSTLSNFDARASAVWRTSLIALCKRDQLCVRVSRKRDDVVCAGIRTCRFGGKFGVKYQSID